MILQKIIIENFKGIQEAVSLVINPFNVIVGQNDVGKSTILKALDCFLNNTTPTTDDLNNRTLVEDFSITLEFNPLNVSIIIDDIIETTFEDEELINSDSRLVIKKVWDTSKAKITADTYLLRKKYDENDFLNLTEAQLIALCKKSGIETSKANGEEFNNKEKRQKIRELNQGKNLGFKYEFEKLPTSGNTRLKNINDAIKLVLPRFEYFKADTSLSESDSVIQKFFKALAIRTIEEEIDTSDVEKVITERLSKVLEKVSSKINQVVSSDSEVTPAVEFDWSKLVSTKFKSSKDETDIPLASRGDGFRRITMMAYFEYLAEQEITEKQRIIFGFEEPETFLHPSGQENLFHKLHDLCCNDYQVIVSTHSPIIVANSQKSDLIHIHKIDGKYNVVQQIQDVRHIATDLGIKVDNQFISLFDKAKAFLLVEGIDDANAFNYICGIYKGKGLISKTFNEIDVAIIPVGGCNSIKHWVSLDLLKTLAKPYFIFQDSDKTTPLEPSPTKAKLEEMGFVESEHFYVSKKRNIENYISATALNRIVAGANLTYSDFDNVKKICSTHPMAGRLGGNGVTDRQFGKLTFDELRSTFFDGVEDEFIRMFNRVNEILR